MLQLVNKTDTDFDPHALLKDHEKDITGLGEKVSKCYSQDRYEEFQSVVEKIVLKTISGKDGAKEIKEYATEATKTYLAIETWKQKTFWIPTIIAIIAIVVGFLRK